MTVRATIILIQRDGKTRGLGEYEFLQLPAPNDQLTIGAVSGDIDIYRVLHLEHRPVSVNRSPLANPNPGAMVMVEGIGDWDPLDKTD
jgi:hypothetical protein